MRKLLIITPTQTHVMDYESNDIFELVDSYKGEQVLFTIVIEGELIRTNCNVGMEQPPLN
jgi:hypothetical protein